MALERNGLKAEDRRALRRAFIAASEAAHVETVARLHPARGEDGKPLFMDSAALGPRTAAKAVLVLAADAAGSHLLKALLQQAIAPPPDARLVLVQGLDPAWAAWSAAMLQAVATEDLSQVTQLAVLDFTGGGLDLATLFPTAAITVLNADAEALPRVRTALAQLA